MRIGARLWTLFITTALTLLLFAGSSPFVPAASAGGVAGGGASPGASAGGPVDMALVLAVDVSDSVDDQRFNLQMDGVAAALDSAAVRRAVLSGPRRSILIAFVQWSNKPKLVIPWTRLSSDAEIKALAIRIKGQRRMGGDFTCMSNMMQYVADKLLPLAPVDAARRILDISGDGRDNCNGARTVDSLRDELVSQGATINGLPVVTTGRDDTLERWFTDHVIGGDQSFVMPAFGYDDFGHAIQQKLVSEISGLAPPPYASSISNRAADRCAPPSGHPCKHPITKPIAVRAFSPRFLRVLLERGLNPRPVLSLSQILGFQPSRLNETSQDIEICR